MNEKPPEVEGREAVQSDKSEMSGDAASSSDDSAVAIEEGSDLTDGDELQPESPPANESLKSSNETGTPRTSESPIDDQQGLLIDRIEELMRMNIEQMLSAFESKLAYDASKQLQIDRLHEEVQQHRSGLVGKAARPYMQGMVQLHDDIRKLIVGYRAKPEKFSADTFFDVLEGLQEDVERTLSQCGITPFLGPGSTFDPRRQTALRVEDCDDEAVAGTVKESIRPGFEEDGKVLEKERVLVYRLRAKPMVDESKTIKNK